LIPAIRYLLAGLYIYGLDEIDRGFVDEQLRWYRFDTILDQK
jgi:hypothetical protein